MQTEPSPLTSFEGLSAVSELALTEHRSSVQQLSIYLLSYIRVFEERSVFEQNVEVPPPGQSSRNPY